MTGVPWVSEAMRFNAWAAVQSIAPESDIEARDAAREVTRILARLRRERGQRRLRGTLAVVLAVLVYLAMWGAGLGVACLLALMLGASLLHVTCNMLETAKPPRSAIHGPWGVSN